MIHPLKILSIKEISNNITDINIIIDHIPEDLHDFTKDFDNFFKSLNKMIINKCEKNKMNIDIFENRYLFSKFFELLSLQELLLLSIKFDNLEVFKYLHQNGADIDADSILYSSLLILFDKSRTEIQKSEFKIIKHVILNNKCDNDLIIETLQVGSELKSRGLIECCINRVDKDALCDWFMEYFPQLIKKIDLINNN